MQQRHFGPLARSSPRADEVETRGVTTEALPPEPEDGEESSTVSALGWILTGAVAVIVLALSAICFVVWLVH